MDLFRRLMGLPEIGPFLDLEEDDFVEEKGWRDLLRGVRELKERDLLERMIREAAPKSPNEGIIRGFLSSLLAEMTDGPVKLRAFDYAGSYLERGELILKVVGGRRPPDYVGMGMNPSDEGCRLVVEGPVGRYVGYRSPRLSMEIKGNAGHGAATGTGGGKISIQGNVLGGLGGQSMHTTMEVMGSVEDINGENLQCTILISGDVRGNIGEGNSECFIKVCGSIGLKYKGSNQRVEVAPGLSGNSVLLVGGDVFGDLGMRMELARVYVWGRVYGDVRVDDTKGGFIYLNKKKAPLLKRLGGNIGRGISVKFVKLRDGGYLLAEGLESCKDLVKE